MADILPPTSGASRVTDDDSVLISQSLGDYTRDEGVMLPIAATRRSSRLDGFAALTIGFRAQGFTTKKSDHNGRKHDPARHGDREVSWSVHGGSTHTATPSNTQHGMSWPCWGLFRVRGCLLVHGFDTCSGWPKTRMDIGTPKAA